MQKYRMILWAVNIFQWGIPVPSLPLSAAAPVLSAVRAAATSSPCQISCKRQHLPPWEATTACTAVVCSLWETGGGTEWEQATGCQLDHTEDALKKEKNKTKTIPLSFCFSYSVLGLGHFVSLLNSIFWGGRKRLCDIHFASFCHGKQHCKIKERDTGGRCC